MSTLGSLAVGSKIKIPHSVMGDIIFLKADKDHSGYPTNATTLITEKILLHRAFDAKEPNNTDSNRLNYGNNKYSVSNLDQWLNSSAASSWYSAKHNNDQSPNSINVVSQNAYDTDAGFLAGFDSAFVDALMDTTLKVVLNTVTDGGSYESIVRKVFLASSAEVFGAAENSIMEGSLLSLFSANTNACRIAYTSAYASSDNSAKGSDAIAANSAYYWWLRTPVSSDSCDVRVVAQGGGFGYSGYAYNGPGGVRPLCNLDSGISVSDTTDTDGCYTFVTAETLVAPVITLGGDILSITDADGNAEEFDIYADGVYQTSVQKPASMPSVGQLITMNLDGTNRQYRVLKVSGEQAEVVCMSSVGESTFGSDNTYAGSSLDTYLNSTWYSTLTAAAKAAIVSKTFNQDSWYTGTDGSPVYSGHYGTTAPSTSSYSISKGSATYGAQITRNVYALSVQDVIDYVTNTDVGDGKLENYNIWKMFWNTTTMPSISDFPRLRSALAAYTAYVWYVHRSYGSVSNVYVYSPYAVRPALTIDLSKISWTIQPVQLSSPELQLSGSALSWGAVSHADYYSLYYSTTSGGTKSALADNLTGTSYDLSSFGAGTYYITAKAHSSSANYTDSDYSSELTYTVAPSEPQGFSGDITVNNTYYLGGKKLAKIKFDTPPASEDDYDSAVDNQGNILGITSYENKTKVYTWYNSREASGILINGVFSGSDSMGFESALEVELNGNYDIALCYQYID